MPVQGQVVHRGIFAVRCFCIGKVILALVFLIAGLDFDLDRKGVSTDLKKQINPPLGFD